MFSRVSIRPVSFNWILPKSQLIENYSDTCESAWEKDSYHLSPIEYGMYAFPFRYEEGILIPNHHFHGWFKGLPWYHLFYLSGRGVKIYHHLSKDPTVRWEADSLTKYIRKFREYINNNYIGICNDDAIIYKNYKFEVVIKGNDSNITKVVETDSLRLLTPYFRKKLLEQYSFLERKRDDEESPW